MTAAVPATSLGWLAPDGRRPWRGRVLAAFPSALYLAPAGGGPLVLVHDAAHGCTPTSVRVDRRRLAPSGWRSAAGDTAAVGAGHLRLGGLLVDLRHAPVWRPPTPATTTEAPSAAWAHGLAERSGARAADPWLPSALDRLVGALEAGRAPAVTDALARLVGRGPGLTPAGDDALVGLLAVLHRVPPEPRLTPRTAAAGPAATGPAATGPAATGALAVLRRHLPPLLGRTTPISAHYLALALDGAFTEHLAALVDEVAATGTAGADAVGRVAATGATSGADALAGVAAALVGAASRTPAGAAA